MKILKDSNLIAQGSALGIFLCGGILRLRLNGVKVRLNNVKVRLSNVKLRLVHLVQMFTPFLKLTHTRERT